MVLAASSSYHLPHLQFALSDNNNNARIFLLTNLFARSLLLFVGLFVVPWEFCEPLLGHFYWFCAVDGEKGAKLGGGHNKRRSNT